MKEFFPFIIIGLVSGSVYGLAGVGLVLTYKTSGIFNFAYGSLAALSVFIFYWLHVQHGIPWPYAAIICIFVIAPIEGLGFEYLARSLERVGATLKVIATVGLTLIVLGIGTVWYGSSTVNFPSFLDTSTIKIFGVHVGWDQITVFLISLVSTAVLYYFFRYVRLGAAMRGVVDNADLVALTGENPIRVRRWAWVIGMMFASMAGLLLAPSLSLDALVITLLVVQAFGAAAIGYFSSLPLTFVGGLAIGIGGALATKYASSVSWLTGFPASLPFLVLFVVLIITPRARLAERRIISALPVRKSWYAPTRMRLLSGAVVIVVFAFIPQMVGSHLSVWADAMANIILFLSLGLLVRTSGQISLCPMAFAAVGGAALGHFAGSFHIPWLLALLLAGLVAVPVGAIIAIPAIRLSGVFLAIATYGFGILLEQLFYQRQMMFGQTTAGITVPRPHVKIGGWDMATNKGFYYVLLIAVVATVAILVAIQRGRMGRLLSGMADSQVALETHGAATNVMKVMVFCISAGLASIAGALIGSELNFGIGATYSSFDSLVIATLLVITVAGDPWYGIIAAIFYSVIPGYITISNISTYEEIAFGVFAVGFAASGGRAATVPVAVQNVINRLGGRRAPALAFAGAGGEAPAPLASLQMSNRSRPGSTAPAVAGGGGARMQVRRSSGKGLEVRDLSVQFGGVRAVSGVSLQAPLSRITGLVGPNGAGKTTTFNACSGLVRPTRGRIEFGGRNVGSYSPSRRSRLGLGRTFQRAELFNSLTVLENVALGREAAMAGANPISQLVGSRGSKRELGLATQEAIELTGIGDLMGIQAGLLPAGQRRLVELARTLAGPFDLLLLDEPSSGLDATETRRFGELLLRVVAERGAGILLVEHDMALVRQVCEYVYVLDFGRLIFEGSPDAMMASEEVRSAYLGSEAMTDGQPDGGLTDGQEDPEVGKAGEHAPQGGW